MPNICSERNLAYFKRPLGLNHRQQEYLLDWVKVCNKAKQASDTQIEFVSKGENAGTETAGYM